MSAAPLSQAEAPATAGRYEPPSLYVDPAYYDWLVAVSGDLNRAVIRPDDPAARAPLTEAARLLTLEARLLDQRAHSTWLSLYAEECAYWIAPQLPAPDPRAAITLEFHDRRRLVDRIARLDTGLAYSQLPVSRTARQYGGIELWPSALRLGDWHVRCSFALAESRQGRNRQLAGWAGFVLRDSGTAGLRIVVKQVNLIDCDSPQGNNSFFL